MSRIKREVANLAGYKAKVKRTQRKLTPNCEPSKTNVPAMGSTAHAS